MGEEEFKKALKEMVDFTGDYNELKNDVNLSDATISLIGDAVVRAIIRAAREIVAAAGDDIAEKPTPAESSPENKGYLPNTYFANNGIAYTD